MSWSQPTVEVSVDLDRREYNMLASKFVQQWVTKQNELNEVNQTLEYWKQVHGWFSEGDVAVYRALVQSIPFGKMAEVGTWKGRSLSSIIPVAKLVGIEEIVAIDTFKGSPGELTASHIDATYLDIRVIFERSMQDVNANNLVRIHEGNQEELVNTFPDEYFNLVFIDAEHHTNNVINDITRWLPKVQSGGYLAGHDYDWESVATAVRQCFPAERIHTFASCWWISKE